MEIIAKDQQDLIIRSKLPNIDIKPKEQQEIIFRSKLPDIDIPNECFPLHTYLFQNTLSKFSSRPCLINASTGKTYTYADVDLISRKVGAGLFKLGIHQGDVIMLALHNSPEFMFAFLGASHIGATSTTVNPIYLPDDIIKQAKASNSKIIITSSKFAVNLKDFASENGIKLICTDVFDDAINLSKLIEGDENELPKVKIHPDDTVALLYSSGTTGLPKGVLLTHKMLVTCIAQHVDGENPNFYIKEEDVTMVVLPLFHLYSLCTVMLCGLRAGSAMLLIDKFEINSFLDLIEKYKVTILPTVSPMLSAVVNKFQKSDISAAEKSDVSGVEKYDTSSVRMLISAAAPLGKKLAIAVKERFSNAIIGQVYGMTEASVMTICMCFAKERTSDEWKFGSCGNVVRNGELKIVDPITRVSLPCNQHGEVCFRGDNLCKGYLNNKQATENTIDKEGWLLTGDIGYIDEDGELFLVDRIKELIKYKGYQVPPAEIEIILLAHPEISDAAVVSKKDEVVGEIPVAFVVLTSGSTLSEEDIKQYVSKQVVFYKRIHGVFFVDLIPKAESGKIARKDLREKLAADNKSGSLL